jgi:hypothetical protein
LPNCGGNHDIFVVNCITTVASELQKLDNHGVAKSSMLQHRLRPQMTSLSEKLPEFSQQPLDMVSDLSTSFAGSGSGSGSGADTSSYSSYDSGSADDSAGGFVESVDEAMENILAVCGLFLTDLPTACDKAESFDISCDQTWAQGCGDAEVPDGHDDAHTLAHFCPAQCSAGSGSGSGAGAMAANSEVLATEAFMTVEGSGQHKSTGSITLVAGAMCVLGVGMVLAIQTSKRRRRGYKPILG